MPRRTRSPSANDLLPGSLEMLLLQTLSHGGRHGYGIRSWVEEATAGVLRVEEGSMYPALKKMEQHGLLVSEWGLSEHGRRAKFYRLTRRGHDQLAEQIGRWRTFVGAVEQLLRTG